MSDNFLPKANHVGYIFLSLATVNMRIETYVSTHYCGEHYNVMSL